MKQLFKPEDVERKVILILKILNESPEPMGARVIARLMKERNVQLSERTVRYHLGLMDERGLTKLVGRRDGRIITAWDRTKSTMRVYRIKSAFPSPALMYFLLKQLSTSKRCAA